METVSFDVTETAEAVSKTYDAMLDQDWWADEFLVILRGGLQYAIMLEGFLSTKHKSPLVRYVQYSKYTDEGEKKNDTVRDVTPWTIYDTLQKRRGGMEERVKRMLIIDDVIETGDTMTQAYRVAKELANEVKITVLADKTVKDHKYDMIYSKKFDPKVWIKFYWEENQ